jgi:hypothetical protein
VNHSKWSEDYPKLLQRHLEAGCSFISFAGQVDVAVKTLYEWLDKYPEFKQVKDTARKRRAKLYA